MLKDPAAFGLSSDAVEVLMRKAGGSPKAKARKPPREQEVCKTEPRKGRPLLGKSPPELRAGESVGRRWACPLTSNLLGSLPPVGFSRHGDPTWQRGSAPSPSFGEMGLDPGRAHLPLQRPASALEEAPRASVGILVQDFRVVCDNMLQGLGRSLRCLGVDVRILGNDDEHRRAAEVGGRWEWALASDGSGLLPRQAAWALP